MATFADLTAEERDQAQGMWAECTDCMALDAGLSVIDVSYEEAREVLLVGPNVHMHEVPFEDVTLRPDLPRAWNADGTPYLKEAH